eukprot:2087570-Prymnesium_polylepis.2
MLSNYIAFSVEGTDRSIDEIGGTSHTAMHARHIKAIRFVHPQELYGCTNPCVQSSCSHAQHQEVPSSRRSSRARHTAAVQEHEKRCAKVRAPVIADRTPKRVRA